MVTPTLEIINSNYDEDLQRNPFLLTLQSKRKEAFNGAIERGWMICVPKAGSFNHEDFTEDDFLSHILVQVEAGVNKYKTLKNQNVIISGKSITTEKGFEFEKKVELLFDELIYQSDGKSYRVCCVSEPFNQEPEKNGYSSTYFVLDSVEDCTDLLWGHTGNKSLQNKVDGMIHQFYHKIETVHSTDVTGFIERVSKLHLKAFAEVAMDKFLGRAIRNDGQFQNYLKLALEVYILNGVYQPLFRCLTDLTSKQDALLNKVTRNWHDIRASKAGIRCDISDNIPRARRELDNIPKMTTPLGKCSCLKRAIHCLGNLNRGYAIPSASDGQVITSDDLLSVLTFLIIKTDISTWYAQLLFAREFRLVRSTSDDEYEFLLSTLEAALEHVSNLASKIAEYDSLSTDIVESPKVNKSPLGLLFSMIERGEMTNVKDILRRGHKSTYGPMVHPASAKRIQKSQICDPLCQCSRCRPLLFKKQQPPPLANQNGLPTESDSSITHSDIYGTRSTNCLSDASEREIERKRRLSEILGNNGRDRRSITSPDSTAENAVTVHSRDERGWTALHVASLHGQASIVSQILDLSTDLNASDVQGRTSLHLASAQGHQDVILLLLESGADINASDCDGYRAIHLATERGHETCVKALLYFGVSNSHIDIDAVDFQGNTALHLAAKWGFDSLVDLLLESGASPQVRNSRNALPSTLASTRTLAERLQQASSDFLALLSRTTSYSTGFYDPSARPSLASSISTPSFHSPAPSEVTLRSDLATSTSIPNADVAVVLKEEDSFLIISNESASTDKGLKRSGSKKSKVSEKEVAVEKKFEKLLKAAADGDLQMVRFHLGITGEIEDDDNDAIDMTQELCHPLCQCHKCMPLQKLTIAANSGELHVNRANQDGFTCLHVASIHGHVSLTQFLITRGADVNCRTQNLSCTPVHLAALYNKLEVLLLLVKSGATVHCKDRQGSLPLHYAALKGHYQVVASLVQNGSDINCRNSKGNTPLHEAARHGHAHVARFLLWRGAIPDPRNRQQLTPSHLASTPQVAKVIDSAIKALSHSVRSSHLSLSSMTMNPQASDICGGSGQESPSSIHKLFLHSGTAESGIFSETSPSPPTAIKPSHQSTPIAIVSSHQASTTLQIQDSPTHIVEIASEAVENDDNLDDIVEVDAADVLLADDDQSTNKHNNLTNISSTLQNKPTEITSLFPTPEHDVCCSEIGIEKESESCGSCPPENPGNESPYKTGVVREILSRSIGPEAYRLVFNPDSSFTEDVPVTPCDNNDRSPIGDATDMSSHIGDSLYTPTEFQNISVDNSDNGEVLIHDSNK